MRKSFLYLIPALFSGCAVGPTYVAPAIEAPPTFLGSAAHDDTAGSKAQADLVSWWRSFDDPLLARLVEQAAWLPQPFDPPDAASGTGRDADLGNRRKVKPVSDAFIAERRAVHSPDKRLDSVCFG